MSTPSRVSLDVTVTDLSPHHTPASPPSQADEVAALRAAYAATRALMKTNHPGAAQAIIDRLCATLGAEIVSADSAHDDVLPINVTIDAGEPRLLVASDPEVRRQISRYVVPALADARLVAHRKQSEELLTEDATRDPLTGLWNRRSLELAIHAAKVGDCIAMLDLDHFKRVNDTFGHGEGDLVLSAFASFLGRRLRHMDIFGRLGGEEFVIIFTETQLRDTCEILCRLRQQWAETAPHGTTFSAGVATVGPVTPDAVSAGAAALSRADALMYRAKAAGRNVVWCEGADNTCEELL